ncbi:MAG: EAL domain-containing protein [Shewanella sp.]
MGSFSFSATRAFILWTFFIGCSLMWNAYQAKNSLMSSAYEEAQNSINKDMLLRKWSVNHGGVYVPVTESQQPVKWLEKVKERDVMTPSGRLLTLLNPASITKQTMRLFELEYGIQGQITSLDPINPLNAADKWETRQLLAFEDNKFEEVWESLLVNEKHVLRYMKQFKVKSDCLKCHTEQGYQLGDIIGGIGVTLPMQDNLDLIQKGNYNLSISYGIIWILGLLGIYFYYKIMSIRIEEKKDSEAALRIYKNAFQSSSDPTLIFDIKNSITDVNDAFFTHTGYKRDELIGKNWNLLHSKKTPSKIYHNMMKTLENVGHWQGEVYGCKKTGESFSKWLSIAKIIEGGKASSLYISSYKDISEHKEVIKRIAHLAHYDLLTNLHNRFSLDERLTNALVDAKRNNHKLAVLFLDLDNFKVVNDTLGHDAGDQLLLQVSKNLRKIVRNNDVLARISGDEFIIVLNKISDNYEAGLFAERVLKAINNTYQVKRNQLFVTCSIGISLYPYDENKASELLNFADIAMYQAKSTGKGNYQFFSKSMSIAIQERSKLDTDMRVALMEDNFELFFQPILNTKTLKVEYAEALIRWNHPEKGFISPENFISIAEDSGFIVELGAWVIQKACQSLAAIQQEGIALLSLSVNLSPKQLHSSGLVDVIKQSIKENKLNPCNLEFEITETAAMENLELAQIQLQGLKQLGITLTIDDFGTGYSSLAYLKKLPFKKIKIDKMFISDLGYGIHDEEITIATISLAKSLKLNVVAEGVETKAQADFLFKNDCDLLQGYLFSKPLPLIEFCQFVINHNGELIDEI